MLITLTSTSALTNFFCIVHFFIVCCFFSFFLGRNCHNIFAFILLDEGLTVMAKPLFFNGLTHLLKIN